MRIWSLCILVSLLACGNAVANNHNWLTVAGDATLAAAETVQVDPVTITSPAPGRRGMSIRVNRAAQRTSWDGVKYRSYVGLVHFDCSNAQALYTEIDFYARPLWQGESIKRSYTTGPQRPMRFLDFEPNPQSRIVKAACG